MSQDHLLLDSYLKALKLPTIKREYPAAARQCAQANAAYEAFLQQLAELEVQHRQVQSIERRLKQAGFPLVKELDQFDFSAAPKLNKKRVLDLARCQFIDQRFNLVLTGAPGTGKTHLASRGEAVRPLARETQAGGAVAPPDFLLQRPSGTSRRSR